MILASVVGLAQTSGHRLLRRFRHPERILQTFDLRI